jgi:hypothetical protein
MLYSNIALKYLSKCCARAVSILPLTIATLSLKPALARRLCSGSHTTPVSASPLANRRPPVGSSKCDAARPPAVAAPACSAATCNRLLVTVVHDDVVQAVIQMNIQAYSTNKVCL